MRQPNPILGIGTCDCCKQPARVQIAQSGSGRPLKYARCAVCRMLCYVGNGIRCERSILEMEVP